MAEKPRKSHYRFGIEIALPGWQITVHFGRRTWRWA
jgi:hypothetical protein